MARIRSGKRWIAAAAWAIVVATSAGLAAGPDASAGVAPTTGPGRYGIASGALLFNATNANFNADMNAIKGLGARWLRTPLKWSQVETRAKGSFNWQLADRVVNGATTRGLSLVLTIVSTPTWALPRGANGNSSYPPANLQDYADFAKASAMRYGDRVQVWELGNEPNHDTGWEPAADPARYAQLLKLTYPAIKSADPTALVLMGGLGGVQQDAQSMAGDTFLANLYQNGAGPYFDAVSYHPYTYPYSPYDTLPAGVDRGWSHMLNARQIMVNNGDSAKQIWASEYGAPTNGGKYSVSEARQAQLVKDAYSLFGSYPWAGPLMWFQHRDKGTNTGSSDDWFGLLRSNRTDKPSAVAYRAGVAAAGG